MSLLTVSNLFEGSINFIQRSICCSRNFSCSCRTTKIISVVCLLIRKSHDGCGQTLSTMYSLSLERMKLATIFPAIVRRIILLLFPVGSSPPPFLLVHGCYFGILPLLRDFFHIQVLFVWVCSLVVRTNPPNFRSSAGIPSGQGLLLFWKLLVALVTYWRNWGYEWCQMRVRHEGSWIQISFLYSVE